MNQYQFLSQLNNIPKPGGDGVRTARYVAGNQLKKAVTLTSAALTDNSAGTANTTLQAIPDPTDTPATADALRDDIVANGLPAIRNNFADLAAMVNKLTVDVAALKVTAGIPTLVETNASATTVAASTTDAGTFVFVIPEDYDEVADEFKLIILANSAGDTNTPILDATIYRKRGGAALSADLNPTASSAIPTNTAKAAERTITASGNLLKAGDVLTINLLTGAHTTDAVIIHSVSPQYKSSIVFNDPLNRSGVTTS